MVYLEPVVPSFDINIFYFFQVCPSRRRVDLGRLPGGLLCCAIRKILFTPCRGKNPCPNPVSLVPSLVNSFVLL